MRVLIAGASGFIGTELVRFLKEKGHEPIPFDRARPDLCLDPDAIINLAGASLTQKWWTAARKQEILESRVNTTKRLSRIPAPIFIQVSAVGFYGDRGDAICTEETPNGSGFLADVCREWEKAARPEGRKVILRLGVVLSKRAWLFKLVAGKRYVSWIALEDLLEIFHYVLTHPVDGVFNAVAPQPFKSSSFLTLPAFFLRLFVGRERADELLLKSTRAIPQRLQKLGFHFRYPELSRYATF